MNDSKPNNKPLWLGLAGLGAVVALIFIVFYIVIQNGVINDGNKKQQNLITQYNDTTNILSDCLVKTKQSIGVANAQTGALNKVITDAVRGRYEEGSSAQPGSSNALFSAISEAYPDTQGLSKVFGDVMITINGCRSDFRDSQAILQRGVTNFNNWRDGSFTVRSFGGDKYPNDDLEIEVNGKPVTGNDALRQMRRLVVVSEAQEGRDTNRIDNVDPFQDTGTTTTPTPK